jgi:hypothetical protein
VIPKSLGSDLRPFPLWQRAVLFSAGYFVCAEAANFLSASDTLYVSFWLPAGLYVSVLLVAPESREIVAESIRLGREEIFEHRLVRKDGTFFFGEARARNVRVGNRSLRMAALRDVTERKQADGTSIIVESLAVPFTYAGRPAILNLIRRPVCMEPPKCLGTAEILSEIGTAGYFMSKAYE